MSAQPSPSLLRILLVQDDEPDWLAWQDQVVGEITRCTRATEALEQLEGDAASFDLVMADDRLPDMSGLELCQELLDRECPLPLVLLVASGAEGFVAKALKAGVDNYVIKDPERRYLDLLPAVLLETVRCFNDRLAHQRMEKELQQRTAQMEALRQVGLELTAELNLDALLHSIASRAVELLGGSTGGLYLYRPERNVLEFSVAVGPELAPIGTVLRRGEGLSGKVWETGEPFVLDDYQHWRDRAPVWDGYPITAVVSVPVCWGDEFLGVLNVHRDALHVFVPADVEILSFFATQAAIAIKNARLYEDERQRRQEAETLREAALALTAALDREEVIERILAQLEKVVPFDSASVQLLKDDHLEIVGGRGFSNLPDLMGVSFPVSGDNPNHEVVRTRAAFIVPDVQTVYDGFLQSPHRQTLIRSWLGVPVLVGEQLVGMIALDKKEPEFYTQEHARLAEAFATQAAIAVENSRLFETAQRRAQELARLHAAAVAVSSSLELGEVLRALAKQMGETLGLTSAYICDWNKDAASITVLAEWIGPQATETERESDLGVTYDVHQYPTLLRTLHEKQPRVIQASDPALEPAGRQDATYYGWQSLLFLPLVIRDRVIGYAELWETRREREFDEAEVRLCQTLAADAAGAIERARLFQAERAAREAADTLRQVSHAVSSTLEMDKVLALVLHQLMRVLAYDTASVLLFANGKPAMVATRGYENTEMVKIEANLRLGDSAILQAMARDHRPVVIADVREDERWIWVPGSEKVRAWIGVPLLVRDETIGALMIDSHQPGSFTHKDATVAQALANQVAVAIENARLFEAQREQRELAEALAGAAAAVSSTLDLDQVLDRILDQVSCVLPNDAANVMLIQGDQVRVVRWRGYEHLGGEAYISRFVFHVHELSNFQAMMESKEPLIVSDTTSSPGWVHAPKQDWLRSYVGAPVCLRGQVVGFLNLDSATPNFFTPTQAQTLQAFADHAAVAIENAQLFDAQARRRQEAETLRQVTAALTSTLDLTQVLDLILEQLAVVVTYDSAAVMLVEEDNLVVVAGRGFPEPARVMSLVFTIEENDLFREMQATRSPLILPDARTDARFLGKGGTEYVRGWMGIPMRIKDRVIGSLTIDSLQPGVYTEADAQIAQAFAQQAAIAIENARLYQEIRGHAEQLEARVQERTAQLQAQYARLDAILRSTTDGIIVTDAQGNIIQANPVAQTWLTQALSPRDATRLRRVVQDLAQRARERPKRVLELTGMDLELEAAPILGPEPDSAQDEPVVVAVHDVSHLKALDRVKSRFVTHVSHELRTPVTTIKLYTELMRRKPEKREQYLDVLQQQADHQARLVKDILQISHIDAGRLELETRPTHLNELSEIVTVGYRTLAQERNLALEHQPASPGPLAWGDLDYLSQALKNLVLNAILYTPERGRVTVSTGQAQAQGRLWATVTVADTGMGIPQDELPHIFERFFRGETPRLMQISGTGLGLAIVQEIVALHGGRVTVESEVGAGSTFTVWLPLIEAQR